MIQLTQAIPYTIVVLVAITVLDALGAIASRVYNIKYASLAILSIAIYTHIGYYISAKCGLSVALLVSLIAGFYDATVGWKISKGLKANYGLPEEDLERLTNTTNLTVMLFVAPFFAIIGHLLHLTIK